jgi:hypothetical protein
MLLDVRELKFQAISIQLFQPKQLIMTKTKQRKCPKKFQENDLSRVFGNRKHRRRFLNAALSQTESMPDLGGSWKPIGSFVRPIATPSMRDQSPGETKTERSILFLSLLAELEAVVRNQDHEFQMLLMRFLSMIPVKRNPTSLNPSPLTITPLKNGLPNPILPTTIEDQTTCSSPVDSQKLYQPDPMPRELPNVAGFDPQQMEEEWQHLYPKLLPNTRAGPWLDPGRYGPGGS